MGEKFAVNAVTGTSSMSIPLGASPGRDGFGPQLSLTYDSGAGNGPFGFGWQMPVPVITRKTDKGLPRYRDGEETDVFILAGAEDLVPVLDAQGARVEFGRTVHKIAYRIRLYRPRVEGLFSRIERWTETATGVSHWRTISRDNIVTLFGRDSNSRIVDPADPRRVFSYLVSLMADNKGNVVHYDYVAEDSVGVDKTAAHEANRMASGRAAQRYLKTIRYGNQQPWFPDWSAGGAEPALPADWHFQLVFDYGDHDHAKPTPIRNQPWPVRPDPFSHYRAGFEVRSYRRCSRILMFHDFPREGTAGASLLVRSSDLRYSDEEAPADPANPIHTFLQSITQAGYRAAPGGYARSPLPPVEFAYSQPRLSAEVLTLTDAESRANLPEGIDGARFRWVDLDGEGLSGILSEEHGGWSYKRNLSPINTVAGPDQAPMARARFGASERIARLPLPGLDQPGGQFLDLDGNGRLELVSFEAPVPGYRQRTADADWEPFKPLPALPAIRWSEPNLQFVDLTGDGLADVLITEEDAYTFYRSLGLEGFAEAERIPTPPDEERGPHLVYADGTFTVSFADMSGGGLRDLVRVCNGEVCYWPNLGYGKFGAKVTMDGSPRFDCDDLFDPKRVRLVDIDGSGSTDVVYIGAAGVDVFFNQSGNALARRQRLAVFPDASLLSGVQTMDLLGNGTACLVWSSPLPAEGATLRYVDLMGSCKPHLLVSVRNNLGAETRVRYAPSTRFYLEDKLAGRPWVTRLPFPVQVVERVETFDWIGRSRAVARYAYHHGHFDGVEREFRGFGMVEQWDTEEHRDDTLFPEAEPANEAEESFNPPVLTRSWFHTGAFLEAAAISRQYAGEYWIEPALRGDSPAAVAARAARAMADSVIEAGLTADEQREACRALKGSALRVEVFGLDGSAAAEHPYSVAEHNYAVRCLQRQGRNQHAVFMTFPREALTWHYERNPEDPRLSHEFTLEVDNFGNALRGASIAYPRRPGHAEPAPDLSAAFRAMLAHDQARLHISGSGHAFTESLGEPITAGPLDSYRGPMPSETIIAELTGFAPAGERFGFDEIDARHVALWAGANDIAYEDVSTPDIEGVGNPLGLGRRIVTRSGTLYRRDDLTGLLALGKADTLGLAGETYQLALTPGLVARVFGGLVTDAMLAEGGYVRLGGPDWWAPSGRVYLSPGDGDSPAIELAEAKAHFYRPRRSVDPFGAVDRRDLDPYDLMPVRGSDALGNVTLVDNDYRVLQPWRSTNANGATTSLAFDALGRVAGSAVSGKAGEGDSLAGFVADLDDPTVAAVRQNPLADPGVILGKASSRVVYDPFAYMRTRAAPAPDAPMVYTLARETHAADLAGGAASRYRHGFLYADGFGREAQQKALAEAGPVGDAAAIVAPRWVGSGWTIYNNKGKPVRRYEPFFSATHDFEFAHQTGVSAVLFYDPPERAVATLHPDSSYEKTVFDAWSETDWDRNDTVLLDDPRTDPDVGDFFKRLLGNAPNAFTSWYKRRIGGALGADAAEKAANQDAAQKAAAHAATPRLKLLDSLGRTCLLVVDNGVVGGVRQRLAQRTALDTEDKPLVLIDALGRHVSETCRREPLPGGGGFKYVAGYDMLGAALCYVTMDGGMRLMLPNVANHPLRHWDDRGYTFRTVYDLLQRPTHQYVGRKGAGEMLAERLIYGENHPDPARNLKGKLFRHYDAAGVSSHERYDFKDNLTESTQQMAASYATAPDWTPLAALGAGAPINLVALDAAAAPLLVTGEVFQSASRYDALNRPIQSILPHLAGGKVSILQPGYNDAGLIESLSVWLRRGAAPGALLDPAVADIKAVTNVDYDAHGQRIRIDRGDGLSSISTYDPLTRRLLTFTTTRPSADPNATTVQALSYAYDPAGNVTRLRDDADIHNVVFFRNQRVDPTADYTYDALYRLVAAAGREQLGRNGGGLLPPQQGGNDDGARLRIAAPGDGNALGTYTERYVYDDASNLVQMSHLVASGNWTRRYVYGEASRITASEMSNRLSTTSAPGDNPLGPFSDPYAYDAHGNMTSMPHLPMMRWDPQDRLSASARQVVNAGTPETTYYAYDGAGQRKRKVTDRAAAAGAAPARKAERLYLGGIEIYREYAGDGVTVTLERETFEAMLDKMRVVIAETRTAGNDPAPPQLIRHQFANHLGSATLELDPAGDVISYEEYFPYGSTSYQAVRAQTETPKRYRYTGRERDEENDLSYHGARYYAPWLGRWTACDPSGHADGANIYAYSHNSPTVFSDPSGTEGQDNVDKANAKSGLSLLRGLTALIPDAIVSGKLREAALKLNVDEIRAVANGGSWSDPKNKQFLDWLTNQATKNAGVSSHTIPPKAQISLAEELAKGPEAFRKAAAQLMVRNFGEVKELESLTAKAVGAIKKTNRPSRALADAVNKSIRGRIARAATEDAKLVSDALKEIHIDPKTLTFMKAEGDVAKVANEATKAAGAVSKVVKAVAPVAKALKPLAPAVKVAGKAAGGLAVAVSAVELVTAKNTEQRVDAGIGLVGNSLMMSKHPVAIAAGGGILVGQALEHNLNVSKFASQHGIDTKEYLERKGVNETVAFVAGGVVTVASTPVALGEAAVAKVRSWF
ncbi:MAG: SpvB/TcaC N-terminal domain-containing protein [Methylocystis sp.]|uniref:SpvB/TcaC N-terminal domain-containing protein n=1 Tax=Methylocystis sp. TaxID=1911079 RepID=UPI003DA67AF4